MYIYPNDFICFLDDSYKNTDDDIDEQTDECEHVDTAKPVEGPVYELDVS